MSWAWPDCISRAVDGAEEWFHLDNGMRTEVRVRRIRVDVARGGFASLRFKEAGTVVIVTEAASDRTILLSREACS